MDATAKTPPKLIKLLLLVLTLAFVALSAAGTVVAEGPDKIAGEKAAERVRVLRALKIKEHFDLDDETRAALLEVLDTYDKKLILRHRKLHKERKSLRRSMRRDEISDDEPEPPKPAPKRKAEAPKAPAAKKPRPSAPCLCATLARQYGSSTRDCKASTHDCLCASGQATSCRSRSGCPCTCKTLVANYDSTLNCKASTHHCLCASNPGSCRQH